MSSFSSSDLGLKVSFSLKVGAVLPMTYTNARLDLIGHAAGFLEYNPKAQHESLAGVIPDISQLEYTDYQYYLFRDSNGVPFIIGEPWINQSSIVRDSNAYLNVKVIGAGSANVEAIKQLLASRNYRNVIVTVHGDS